jgi:hypothetical protein
MGKQLKNYGRCPFLTRDHALCITVPFPSRSCPLGDFYHTGRPAKRPPDVSYLYIFSGPFSQLIKVLSSQKKRENLKILQKKTSGVCVRALFVLKWTPKVSNKNR